MHFLVMGLASKAGKGSAAHRPTSTGCSAGAAWQLCGNLLQEASGDEPCHHPPLLSLDGRGKSTVEILPDKCFLLEKVKEAQEFLLHFAFPCGRSCKCSCALSFALQIQASPWHSGRGGAVSVCVSALTCASPTTFFLSLSISQSSCCWLLLGLGWLWVLSVGEEHDLLCYRH